MINIFLVVVCTTSLVVFVTEERIIIIIFSNKELPLHQNGGSALNPINIFHIFFCVRDHGIEFDTLNLKPRPRH